MFHNQPVQDIVDINRFGNGAIKIRGEPVDLVFHTDLSHLYEPIIIPGRIISPELDFQAFQSVFLDPVG